MESEGYGRPCEEVERAEETVRSFSGLKAFSPAKTTRATSERYPAYDDMYYWFYLAPPPP